MEKNNFIDATSAFEGRRREGPKAEPTKIGKVILIRSSVSEAPLAEGEPDSSNYSKLSRLTDLVYDKGDVDAALYLQTYGWNMLVNSPDEADEALSSVAEYVAVHEMLYPSVQANKR